MRSKSVAVLIFFTAFSICDAFSNDEKETEARGKKKKIALFVYFADLIVKKIFILKLIYAFVFWVVLHKAGYFLGWFVSYLKDKKKEFHHDDHHHHYEYDPSHSYGPSSNYGPTYDSYGPYEYRRQNQGK